MNQQATAPAMKVTRNPEPETPKSELGTPNAKLETDRRLGLAWIIGLGGAVAAIVFLAWLAGEVIEGDTRHFDDWAAIKLHNHASPFLTSLMSGITLLGATRVLIGLGAIVVFGFLFANWRRDA